jgi:biotin operon repressor
MNINITTEQASRCLEILQAADTPLVAAAIAARLYLSGSRETQRRKVRAIIKHLRDGGCRITATLRGGYLLSDRSEWRGYLEGRQSGAKKVIGDTAKRKRFDADPPGQGLLFGQDSIRPRSC